MGKFDGVLLATDFDDTLFRSNVTGPGVSEAERRGEAVVFGRNRQALDYFLAQGGRFTVATGRAVQTFAPYVGRVPINAPAIMANGALIHDFAQEKDLFHAQLKAEIVTHANELAEAFPELGFEVHLGGYIYTYRPNEITRRHIHKLGCPAIELPFEEMPQPWTKLLIQHEEHNALAEAQAWFLQRYGAQYEAIFSNNRLMEITAHGANKGTAVLRVAEHLAISREHIYCVGDNQNDIPMLAVSAEGFAPANCAPEVRDWGASIVCSCDDGAIADVIERLDKRY